MKINKGDIITYKAEWQDKGDENITFVARSDSPKDDPMVEVEAQIGFFINPWQTVEKRMIATVNGQPFGKSPTMRIAITEDGYRFTEQPDGTWTDGDMTFDSLEQLTDSVEIEILDSEPTIE